MRQVPCVLIQLQDCFYTTLRKLNWLHLQHNKFLWSIIFVFCEIIFFFIVVAVCNLVHDVETIYFTFVQG